MNALLYCNKCEGYVHHSPYVTSFEYRSDEDQYDSYVCLLCDSLVRIKMNICKVDDL